MSDKMPAPCRLLYSKIKNIIQDKNLGDDMYEALEAGKSSFKTEFEKRAIKASATAQEINMTAKKYHDAVMNTNNFPYWLRQAKGDMTKALNFAMNEDLKYLLNGTSVQKEIYKDTLHSDIFEAFEANNLDYKLFEENFLTNSEAILKSEEKMKFNADVIKVLNNEFKTAETGRISDINSITTSKEAQMIGQILAKHNRALIQLKKELTGVDTNISNTFAGKMSYDKLKLGEVSKEEFKKDLLERNNFSHHSYDKDIQAGFQKTVIKEHGQGEKISVNAREHLIDTVTDSIIYDKKEGGLLSSVKQEWQKIITGQKKDLTQRSLFYKTVEDSLYMQLKYGNGSSPIANIMNTFAHKNHQINLHDHFGGNPLLVLDTLATKSFFGEPSKIGYAVSNKGVDGLGKTIENNNHSFMNKEASAYSLAVSHNNGLILDKLLGKGGLVDSITALEANNTMSFMARTVKNLSPIARPLGYIINMKKYVMGSASDILMNNMRGYLAKEQSLTSTVSNTISQYAKFYPEFFGQYLSRVGGSLASPIIKNKHTLSGQDIYMKEAFKFGAGFKHMSNIASVEANMKFIQMTNAEKRGLLQKGAEGLANIASQVSGQRTDMAMKSQVANQVLFKQTIPHISKIENLGTVNELNLRLKNEFKWTDKTLAEVKAWQQSELKDSVKGLRSFVTDRQELRKIETFIYSELRDMNFEMSAVAQLNLMSNFKAGTHGYEMRKNMMQLGSFTYTMYEQISNLLKYQAIKNGLNGKDYKVNVMSEIAALVIVSGLAESLILDMKHVVDGKESTISRIKNGKATPKEISNFIVHGMSRAMGSGFLGETVGDLLEPNHLGNSLTALTPVMTAKKATYNLIDKKPGKALNEMQKFSPVGSYDFEKDKIKAPYPVQMMQSVYEHLYKLYS